MGTAKKGERRMTFEDWKKKLEKINQDRLRAEGVLEQSKRELENFGYESVDDAKAALVKMQKDYEKKLAEIEKAEEKFEREYGDLLE